MTTQYSPILKLALPVQGELSGTWGDVVNDNITSMVEQAIAGRAVIDTWTTDSHTLTTANGTTSESRCAMLELTDTGTALTGAGTVICPTASKIYIVKNASGQNITVKTSAGTGILVPDGRTTFLFCDGTNVVEAMTHTTSLQLGTSTTVTAVLDEDNMASDSATSLATQQSIKAYVDAQVGANNELSEVLANGNTSGANDIIVDSGQKITTNTIDETTAGSGVTIDSVLLKDDGVNATNLEVTNIKANDGTAAVSIADTTGQTTITDAVLTTADINGGTADGVVIGGTTPAAATATTVTANTSLTIAGTTTVTSILDEDNMASDDPAGLATQQSIKAYVDAQVGANNELSEVLGNGNTTGGNDILFGDNDKAIFGGATSELQIYSDGSNSYIKDNGTGNLRINAGELTLTNAADNQNRIVTTSNGTVYLYNGGAIKLATTGTGVDITGNTLSSDTFEIDSGGDGFLVGGGQTGTTAIGKLLNSGGVLTLDTDGARSIQFSTGGSAMMRVDGNGNGIIINESGADQDFRVESDSVANMFFVDASTNRIGIKTDAPQAVFQVNSVDPQSTTLFSVRGNGNNIEWGHNNRTSGYYGVLGANNNNGNPFIAFSANANSGTSNTYDTDGFIGTILRGSTGGELSIEQTLLADADDQTPVQRLGISAAEIVVNEASTNTDFRVESDIQSHALFVDAGGSNVMINRSTAINNATLSISTGGTDVTGLAVRSTGGTEYGLYITPRSDGTITQDATGAAAGTHVFSTAGTERFRIKSATEGVFNDPGADYDFRVESDGNANMLFVDAGANEVGIGTNTPDATMHVYGSLTVGKAGVSENHDLKMWPATAGRSVMGFRNQDNYMALMSGNPLSTDLFTVTTGGRGSFIGGLTVNESGAPAEDFRVESDLNSHMLFVDASSDKVGVNRSAPNYTLEVGGNFSTSYSTAQGISTVVHDYQNTTGHILFAYREGANSSGTGIKINGVFTFDRGTASAYPRMGWVKIAIDDDTSIAPNNWQAIEAGGYTGYVGTFRLQKVTYNSIKYWAIEVPQGSSYHANTVCFEGYVRAGDLLPNSNNNCIDGDDPLLTINESKYPAKFTRSADNSQTYNGSIVFNDLSDNHDFRVESDASTHAFFVDSSADRVGIFQSSPVHGFDVNTTANFDGQIRQGRVSKYTNNSGSVPLSGSNPSQAWFKLGTLDNPGQCEILYAIGTGNSEDRGRIRITGTYTMSNIGVEVYQQTYNAHLCKVRIVAVSTGGSDFEVWVSVANSSTYAGAVSVVAQVILAEGASGRWAYAMTTGTPGTAVSEVFVSDPAGDKNHMVLGGGLTVNGDQHPNNDFRVASSSNEYALFVDAGSSEVGINQSNPQAPLHVNGGVTMTGGWIRTQYLEAVFPAIVFKSTYSANSWGGIGYDSSNENMDFWVGSTSEDVSLDVAKKVLRLRDTDGFIWNDSGQNHLDFRVASDNNANMLFVDAGGDDVFIGKNTSAPQTVGIMMNLDGAGGRISISSNNDSSNAVVLVSRSDTGGNTLLIRPNGNVQNQNNSYAAISDINKKENIADASSQWDDIKAVRVRKYSMIDDASATANQIGVIAQELQSAGMGGLVETVPDIHDPTQNDISVKYSILYMKAVKALQEAMDRIETLEAKVTALENA